MTEQGLRGKIAEAFKIAREEGVIRRFANGISDAEEVINWLKEAGYVQLADDQNFPLHLGIDFFYQQDLRVRGWRKVKLEESK